MRSDFENFRPEISISVRLFRIPSDFLEFRLTFRIAGRLWSKQGRKLSIPSGFGKSRPAIVISVRVFQKRSDRLWSRAGNCRFREMRELVPNERLFPDSLP